ncbi:glycosyltransferase [Intrasporangium calvum]|uniref:D-inositol 3-phosphate glycosyltransferase n=1 Tax=Intrasporangium calvum (strain ATCC 23552 / DSM 43043 / JCM 3097 / NBRC 12989 / NCIMB 10167 / NRRL B-3866 / 7 KIP) TaxID=710696 RepID=E6SEU4_INTC7|nr:glycosyltransferase [Intrasporangium calvum]ADU47701.1 glycosyl transferase group 1 [Intrasporangium calvum DSM 43043]
MSHSAVVDAWRERERALRVRGHDVVTLSAAEWDEGGSTVRLAPRVGEAVTGVRTIGRHPALFLYDPRPIWRALGQAWDVIDIHEEPFALSTAEVLAVRAVRRCRAPYVLYSAQNLDKTYPVPFRWLERWALRHAAGVSVCNSEAGRIVERKGLSGTATLIPLGIDLARFSPTRATEGEADPGPHEPPAAARDLDDPVRDELLFRSGARRTEQPTVVRVGYVGRLAAHKGVSVLVEAVAADERLTLRIAGQGPAAAGLRSQVQARGATGRVELTGSVDQADLPDFYRSVDVLAVPSLTTRSWVEQFGRVAVEAMACGTPVVASDSGALPDVVGDAGLLVPPGDAAALRDALLRVGTDPALARRLRSAGLARATDTSWTSVAALQEGLYRAALGPAGATHDPAGATPDPPGATPDPAGATAETRPVDIVVVAYGVADLLRSTLEPLHDESVLVVDNSSSPEVRAVCSALGVRYVDPGHNGGFAAGVNVGLRERRSADSDVLLLNPDARIEPSGIRLLAEALRARPDLASVSPRLLAPDGDEERVLWPFPTPRGAWLDAVGLGRHRRGEFAIGAVLLLRAEAISAIGGFDESFFLYAEETDWAYRAARRGWHHAVVPTVTATHVGAGTSGDATRREVRFHAGQERYYRKHFGAPGWQAARLAQLAGSAVRSLRSGREGRLARERFITYLRGPLRVESDVTPPGDAGATS